MIQHKILKFIAATLTTSTIMGACKKDDNPVPDKTSKLLFNRKIIDITTPKAAQPNTDSTLFKAYMSDNLIKFTNVLLSSDFG